MYTDHFPGKNIDQTTLEMRAAILKSKWRKSCVHTMFGSCAHKNQGHNTAFPVSGENLCEEQCANSKLFLQQFWVIVYFPAFAQYAGWANFCPDFSKKQEEIWSPRTSREHGLFCTSPLDWNSSAWNKEVWKIKERALEFCLKRSLDEQNKKDITPEGLQAPSHSLVVTTAWAKVGRLPICARKSLDV